MRELHPDSEVTPIGDGSVGDHSYPPDDTSYATVLPGAELFCDRRLVCDRPSRKPPRLLRVGAGRQIIMHGMHSVSDRLRFAVWNDGELVRSLFGFILEGLPDPDDADPFDIHLHGYRVADPTGREQADREATLQQALQLMKPPRRYGFMPDGTLREIGDDES